MQVFGVCQLSELKGARRGSPDNQAAIRRGRCRILAASLAEERRITVPPPTSAAEQAAAHVPFPVGAIQVDGGYEFKDEFEQACHAKGESARTN